MKLQPILIAATMVASASTQIQAAEPVMTWSQTYDAGLVHPVVGSGRKIAIDALGNVIVAGSVSSQPQDWLVTKYQPDGTLTWANRFKPGGASDRINGLALDTDGNVHVTGELSGDGLDYLTIKYQADGTPAWTNRFAGPDRSSDHAEAIAVDSTGAVYVTGVSDATGSSPGADYVTIKYAADGVPMWTNRFNGPPGYDHDVAKAISVDSSDSVYVTGYSTDFVTGSDYATIKYQSDGTPVWTNRFNGLLNASDEPTAIALDSLGNVYVAGRSYYFSSSGNVDYATIKYQADGTPVWTNLFSSIRNGTHASIAVDGMGDVLVTGTYPATSSIGDFAIIKYRSDGTTAWVNRYNGTGNSEDHPYAVALDVAGNVYVTGYSFGESSGTDWATIKYQPNGEAVWTNRFTGPGNVNDDPGSLAVDATGSAYVTGDDVKSSSGIYHSIIKYLADGTTAWTNGYTGRGYGGSDSVAKAVADNAGNIYVAGTSDGFGTGRDFLTIKFQPDGTPVWTNRYDSLQNYDEVSDLAIDSTGNVYVMGRSDGHDRFEGGYVLLKYLADGKPAWTNRMHSIDFPRAIAVDRTINIYVTGHSYQSSGCGYLTARYRSDGSFAYDIRYNGPNNSCASASDIVVDSAGFVYVTGSDRGVGTGSDWATVKYRPNGVPVWTNRYDGFGVAGDDQANTMLLDGAGNLYVAGYSRGTGIEEDYALIKYLPDGTAAWTNRYDGPASKRDVANAIAVGSSGSVYVSGFSGMVPNSSNAGADYATIKYLHDGTPAWTNRYDGLGAAYDSASSVAADSAGNVYVTGSSTGDGTSIDHATIKYRPNGTAAWTNRFSGPVLSGNEGAGWVFPLPSGDVVVVGNVANPDGGGDWILYRLAEPPEPNQVSLTLLPDSGVRLRFSGIPGQAYQVQRARSVSGPWTTLATLTAPAHGMIEHIDSNPSPEGAFYRAVSP